MAEILTPQQRAAITDRGGHLLVSAAAGSGKTKVLVDRLLSYLTDPESPANIDEFLIITYTKAAAAELRGKIAAKLSERIAENPQHRHLQQQMQRLYLTKISTVHSFCGDLLKEYAYLLDFSADFRVADENECLQLQTEALDTVLNAAYEQERPDSDFFAFVDSQGLGRDDRQIPQIILSVYSRAKCHLYYEDWLDRCVASNSVENINDASQTVWGKYLMDDLRAYLQLQICAMRNCANAAEQSADMPKAALLLQDTVLQLEQLQSCKTWDEVIARKNLSFGVLTFPKKCENLELIDQIKAVREACKDGLKKKLRRFSDDSHQLLSDIEASAPATRGLVKLVRAFDREYTRLKQGRRVLDFSDLEHKTLDLLLGSRRYGPTAVASEVAHRFREVMVDEYQDSNAVQDAIFGAITGRGNTCFMVGDVKQSIYQFRLADPGIFLDKYNRYVPAQEARHGQERKVLLSKNFRSSGAVIEAVNDVFYDCMFEPIGGLRYTGDEALEEGIPHEVLHEPAVELYGLSVRNDTYAEEAAFVAQRIRQLLDGTHMIREGDNFRAITPGDIVILLRSPGSVGHVFQNELERTGVSCSTDSSTELLEAEEVQLLRSILQIISNPVQDIPLIAVLMSRVFCFTADELASIRAKELKCDFYHVLQQDPDDKAQRFLDILQQLRMDSRMCDLPQLLDRIYLLTQMDTVYASMPDGVIRTQNLRMFYQLAEAFCSLGQGSLDRFLEHLTVIEAQGVRVQTEKKDSNSVRIMSIHKSKGLEFPVVFLCGLSKSFNMEHTREPVLCDSELGLGLSCVDPQQRLRYPTVAKRAIAAKMYAQSVSEELRVLYVAMTRSKDRLIMTYAASNLEKELENYGNRIDLSDPMLLSGEVGSAGEWIIMSALRHREASAFHQIAKKPESTRMLQNPWLIQIAKAESADHTTDASATEEKMMDEALMLRMREGLSFRYPYRSATEIPSKLTATQLKGRYKDNEAAEGALTTTPKRGFRKPEFASGSVSGRQYGIALHTVMQHIRYEACTCDDALEQELKRLVSEGYISRQMADIVENTMILDFFNSSIGQKLRSGVQCLREFKFSVLDDACHHMYDAHGETILLQGVVDCALIEPDGITVVDFKTDAVTDEVLEASVFGYTPQVKAYAHALEKIYDLPVKATYLYYFRLGRAIEL